MGTNLLKKILITVLVRAVVRSECAEHVADCVGKARYERARTKGGEITVEASATLEKAILLLTESQSSNVFYSKLAIGMVCMVAVMMLVSLYLAWKVHEDTTYLRRKAESGD